MLEQMGGTIALTSVLGDGTRVIVELPAEPPSATR
jgi:signal transduction histidine kinase